MVFRFTPHSTVDAVPHVCTVVREAVTGNTVTTCVIWGNVVESGGKWWKVGGGVGAGWSFISTLRVVKGHRVTHTTTTNSI
jgi:hypothetical protein